MLVDAGANIDSYDEGTGRTMIETAAMNGYSAVIRAITQRQVRRYVDTNSDKAALRLAAENGHLTAVRVLLEAGFPADRTDFEGRTALHAAAESGNTAIAEVLIEYGADPALLHYDWNSFHIAARFGHVEVLKLLKHHVSSVDFPSPGDYGTAVHLAATEGHDKVILLLVENGADPNATDLFGFKHLACAVQRGNETTVRMLLELGVSVLDLRHYDLVDDLAYPDGRSYVIGRGNSSLLLLLLQQLRSECDISSKQKVKWIISSQQAIKRIGSLFPAGRSDQNIEAIEMLEQELKLYPEVECDISDI